MKVLKPIFDLIDKVGTWLGKGVAWLLVVLIAALTYDVFMRYVFSKPTVWAFDMPARRAFAVQMVTMHSIRRAGRCALTSSTRATLPESRRL